MPGHAQATVGVRIADKAWHRRLPGATPRVRRAARAAIVAALRGRRMPVRVDITLADDAELKRLNRVWRGKNKPTNVLSFPALAADELTSPAARNAAPRMIGDVIVAAGVAMNEARAERKRLADHVDHLIVHGVLHLLGYDHEALGDARAMERLERRVLSTLGVADPYRGRTRAGTAAA